MNVWKLILGEETYRKMVGLQDEKESHFVPDNLYLNGKLVAPDEADWKLEQHLQESFERQNE